MGYNISNGAKKFATPHQPADSLGESRETGHGLTSPLGERAMQIKDWTLAQAIAVQLAEQAATEMQESNTHLQEALIQWLQKEFAKSVARIISDRALREDAIQVAVLTVWRYLHTYDVRRGSFRAWAEQVATRVFVRIKRGEDAIRHFEMRETDLPCGDEDEAPSYDEQHADATDYVEQAVQKDRLHRLLKCIERALSEEERTLLEGVLSGRTYDQMSEQLRKRSDALRQQYCRCRDKILEEAILDPHIFTNAEIQTAIVACQRGDNPLTNAELGVLENVLKGNPHRRKPAFHQKRHFRNACAKLANYLKPYLHHGLDAPLDSVTACVEDAYESMEGFGVLAVDTIGGQDETD